MHGVLALGSFAGAVALAAYTPDYKELRDLYRLIPDDMANVRDFAVGVVTDIITSIEATAVSGNLYQQNQELNCMQT